MHSNDLEACGMKFCCFWFHFWRVHCTQVSDSRPLDLLSCVKIRTNVIVGFGGGGELRCNPSLVGHFFWKRVLVHLSRRLKCTIVIMRFPSSVVVNFSHFRLLLWNRWTEFNETSQEARSQRPLPSLCFSGRSEKEDDRPGLWLAETFSTSPLKPLNGIQQNLIGSKISTSSTKFVFFGPIGKPRWPP